MSGMHASHKPVDMDPLGDFIPQFPPRRPRHLAYVMHAELIPKRVPCCSPEHPHPMVEGGGEPLEVGFVHYLTTERFAMEKEENAAARRVVERRALGLDRTDEDDDDVDS